MLADANSVIEDVISLVDKHLPGKHNQPDHAGDSPSSRVTLLELAQTPNQKTFSLATTAAAQASPSAYISYPATANDSDGIVTSAVVYDVATSLTSDGKDSAGMAEYAEKLESMPRDDESQKVLKLTQYAAGIVQSLKLNTNLLNDKPDAADRFKMLITDDIVTLAKLIPDIDEVKHRVETQEDVLHTVLNRMGVIDYTDTDDDVVLSWSMVSTVKKHKSAELAQAAKTTRAKVLSTNVTAAADSLSDARMKNIGFVRDENGKWYRPKPGAQEKKHDV